MKFKSWSKRRKMVLRALRTLAADTGTDIVDVEDLVERVSSSMDLPRDRAESEIEQLKMSGLIYSPREGKIREADTIHQEE